MKIGSGRGDNPLRVHGRGSGYVDYRYGEKNARPVYDPSKRRNAREPIIADKNRKKALIREVSAQLREWDHSPFEHEAASRHGLRQAFCEDGNEWQRSDDEAAHIVSEALLNNGAKRPSWLEGQWHYTTPRESCAWCAREIDDPFATRGQRFCSVDCAKAAIQHRASQETLRLDNSIQNAYRLVQRSKAKPKPCKQCGEMFRTERKSVVYCSTRCAGIAKRAPDKECAECGTAFRPHNAGQVFCSHRCATTSSVRERAAAMPERECVVCSERFQPKAAAQRFCSDTCRKRVENLHQRIRQGAKVGVSPWAVDYFLGQASRHSFKLTPERFDALVAA